MSTVTYSLKRKGVRLIDAHDAWIAVKNVVKNRGKKICQKERVRQVTARGKEDYITKSGLIVQKLVKTRSSTRVMSWTVFLIHMPKVIILR